MTEIRSCVQESVYNKLLSSESLSCGRDGGRIVWGVWLRRKVRMSLMFKSLWTFPVGRVSGELEEMQGRHLGWTR